MQYLLSMRMVVALVVAITSTFVATVVLNDRPGAELELSPNLATIAMNETFTVSVMARSSVPANAFTGEIVFDTNRLTVESIDYNTSIANLWVKEPWYNRADNSIYFAGGTTAPGGFSGRGELLRVTLRATQPGDTTLSLRNVRVMAHDGLGTDLPIGEPLDALFTVDTTPYTLPSPEAEEDKFVTVVPLQPNLDLNDDGERNFQDISVLLLNIGRSVPAYDFTGDGQVTWSDVRVWQQLNALED
jgi:hypothetical protein